MNAKLLLVPLLLLSILVTVNEQDAFAQIFEQGASWDKELVSIDGSDAKAIKFTTVPPRIQNSTGDWVNYIFTDTGSALQLETASGSISLDKSSCEFTFYKNQIQGIPSEILFTDDITPGSSVGETNSWIPIPTLDNAACQPSFDEPTLTLSAMKETNDNLMEYKYQKKGQQWKTQLEITNLSAETNKKFGFTQQFDLNRDTIKFGDQVRDLKLLDGSELPRSFLDSNGLKVLDLLNGYKFDFDIGYDNLENININTRGVSGAEMEFEYLRIADTLQPGQTLIIDPTLAVDAGDSGYINDDSNNGICDSGDTLVELGFVIAGMYGSSSGSDCAVADVEFDISSIAEATDIISVTLELEIDIATSNENFDFNAIDFDDLSARSTAQRYSSITTGTNYINAESITTTGLQQFVLGSVANTDVQAEIDSGDGIFSIGVAPDPATQGVSSDLLRFDSHSGTNPPNISILYTLVSPPTGLTVEPVALDEMSLEWIAPVNGSAPVGYLIERESPVGGGWATLVANTTTTDLTYSDTGLTSATQYNYRLSTHTANGTSVPSSAVANYTWGIPAQVTGLNATGISSSEISLEWVEPNENGFAITGYNIVRESPTGGGFSTLVNDTGSDLTTYTDTLLDIMTQYNYKVHAWNSQGNGTQSAAAANYTLPTFPTGLVVFPEGTSTTDLNLEWVAPSPDTGINGYLIERAPSVGGTFAIISANTTNTNTFYNDTSLAVNTYYNYRVSALGNASSDPSIPSNTYSQTTYHLPDAVDNLNATSAGFGSALLEWEVPDTLYGYVLGYMINYTTPTGDPLTIYTNSTGNSDVSAIVGLPINDYSYRVSAVTIHGTNVTGALIANVTTVQSTTLGDLDADFSEQAEVATVPITFSLDTINDTQSVVQVFYDSAMDLDCNFAYKFSRDNSTYSGLTENPIIGTNVYTNFTLNDPSNEIIDINCIDSLNANNTGFFQVSEGGIPFFEQADNFSNGLYGTEGFFGFFDLITLLVVIISMIGFNRYNPAVGVVLMVSLLGALAFYGMIELSGLILGVLALIIVLAIGTVKKS